MSEYNPSKYALMKVAKQIISRSEIGEEIKPVSTGVGYVATPSGKFYRQYGEDKFVPCKDRILDKTGGYRYVTLQNEDGRQVSCRAHRIIAETFIPNPDNLPIVGHKNNIKSDNRVENLEWTTWSANSQKAVDDGLLVNDKGADDSQSIAVVCFDRNQNLVKEFGSAKEAHRELGVSSSTVLRQARHEHKQKPRSGYYFRFKDEVDSKGFIL